jgi:hypothetical protein
MAHAVNKKIESKVCVDPNLIVLDELCYSDKIGLITEESCLINESKEILVNMRYNAKEYSEIIPIEKLKSQINYRNFGVY